VPRFALMAIVNCPTCRNNTLDRMYVNAPIYNTVRVVTPAAESDHKAILATLTQSQVKDIFKRRQKRSFRQRSPTQHVLFLQRAYQMDMDFDPELSLQAKFDSFYGTLLDLLDSYYPERTVTVTASNDPGFVTPAVKSMLRRRNRLMKAGRIEQADAITRQVRAVMTRVASSMLRKLNLRKNPRMALDSVRQVLGEGHHNDRCNATGITAQSLNEHYTPVSLQTSPTGLTRVRTLHLDALSTSHKRKFFLLLDLLHPTATGLDKLPQQWASVKVSSTSGTMLRSRMIYLSPV
jgi:hypothetical protein